VLIEDFDYKAYMVSIFSMKRNEITKDVKVAFDTHRYLARVKADKGFSTFDETIICLISAFEFLKELNKERIFEEKVGEAFEIKGNNIGSFGVDYGNKKR
jgi:hypothetical protein